MCKVDRVRNEFNGQTKIRDFYREAYPSDTWAIDEMNRSATFQDAFDCLQCGFDFYTFLGVADSIVRERVFDALTILMGCDYDYIRDQWLYHSQESSGLVEDMSGLRFKNQD